MEARAVTHNELTSLTSTIPKLDESSSPEAELAAGHAYKKVADDFGIRFEERTWSTGLRSAYASFDTREVRGVAPGDEEVIAVIWNVPFREKTKPKPTTLQRLRL